MSQDDDGRLPRLFDHCLNIAVFVLVFFLVVIFALIFFCRELAGSRGRWRPNRRRERVEQLGLAIGLKAFYGSHKKSRLRGLLFENELIAGENSGK